MLLNCWCRKSGRKKTVETSDVGSGSIDELKGTDHEMTASYGTTSWRFRRGHPRMMALQWRRRTETRAAHHKRKNTRGTRNCGNAGRWPTVITVMILTSHPASHLKRTARANGGGGAEVEAGVETGTGVGMRGAGLPALMSMVSLPPLTPPSPRLQVKRLRKSGSGCSSKRWPSIQRLVCARRLPNACGLTKDR
jgi:hypothetical protein